MTPMNADSRSPSVIPRTWSDPNRCPFCDGELDDGGPGFMTHIESSPTCEEGFELWRERITDDVGGEWIG